MSILTKHEIIRQIKLKNIVIDPYEPDNVKTNSIDVTLGCLILRIDDLVMDVARSPKDVKEFIIGPEGFLVEPGFNYLGCTQEKVHCKCHVPWFDGRSSTARYGLQVHTAAGRGDVGFRGSFTAEIHAVGRPVRIYAGMRFAQISFLTTEGEIEPYDGQYQNQVGPRLPKPLV